MGCSFSLPTMRWFALASFALVVHGAPNPSKLLVPETLYRDGYISSAQAKNDVGTYGSPDAPAVNDDIDTYGPPRSPICRTETSDQPINDKCEKEEECATSYEDKCETEYESKCETKYEKQCETKYDTKCETKYEDKCETKYEDECTTEYKDKCETKYETVYDDKCE